MKNKQYKPKNEIPDLSECILIDLEYKYPFMYNGKIYRDENDCDDLFGSLYEGAFMLCGYGIYMGDDIYLTPDGEYII